MSDPSRHERLSEIFAVATTLPAFRRESFVESEVMSRTMRDDLRALLRFHETLSAPTLQGQVLTDWLQSPGALLPAGTAVGAYVIGELLGRGGTGAVYAARQTGALERDAALKILDLPEPIAQAGRFAAERNAMAMLDHPGIARIFDAGVDGAGRAYIAMERVAGTPIDRWYAENRPTLRQTITLFVRIAEALEYAHGRGVIHRDLKPSNLLVSGPAAAPVAKVIDFGLVAASAGSTLRRWLDATDSSTVGTPLYMPPEQAAPDAVADVRADVYGLGAVLHALLAGRPPLDLSDLEHPAAFELFHAVAVRPRKSLAAAAPHVPRDIAAICDKCLSSTDRYANLSGLIADWRRWLNFRPVAARRATPGYLAVRFIRRNRAYVAGIGACLLLLLIGAVGTLAGFVKAKEENQQFRQQLAANQAVNQFLTDDLLGVAVPSLAGREVRVADLLDRAAPTIAQRFAGRPLVEADLRLTIGETYTRLGNYPAAADMLQRGLALLNQHAAPSHPQRMRALSSLGLNKCLLSQNDDAMKLLTEVISSPGDTTAYRYAVANAHTTMAYIFDSRGEWEQAIRHADLAVGLLEALFKTDQNDGPKLRLVEALNCRAMVLSDAGRNHDADLAMEQLPRRIAELLGPEHYYAISASVNRAAALMDQGNYAAARPLLEAALPVFIAQCGENHPETLSVKGNLISALGNTGAAEQAIAMCRQIIPAIDRAHGPGSNEAVMVRHKLASILLNGKNKAEALEPADAAVKLAVASLGEGQWLTGQCFATRGYCHAVRGEIGAAMLDLQHARTIFLKTVGADHPRTVATTARLNTIIAAICRPMR